MKLDIVQYGSYIEASAGRWQMSSSQPMSYTVAMLNTLPVSTKSLLIVGGGLGTMAEEGLKTLLERKVKSPKVVQLEPHTQMLDLMPEHIKDKIPTLPIRLEEFLNQTDEKFDATLYDAYTTSGLVLSLPSIEKLLKITKRVVFNVQLTKCCDALRHIATELNLSLQNSHTWNIKILQCKRKNHSK